MIGFGEDIEIKNSKDECDYWYGGCDYILTDEDIEILKQGKFINFSVNQEYGCTLSYRSQEDK